MGGALAVLYGTCTCTCTVHEYIALYMCACVELKFTNGGGSHSRM